MSAALVPKPATLKRYGLTLEEWEAILERQGGLCAICETLPKSGRLHIEHQHVKGWKKMPPNERKKWVRGLACFRCNTEYLGRSITVARARNVVSYLEAFDDKLNGAFTLIEEEGAA